MYVRDADQLADAVSALAGEPVLGIDTEFMRERTYYARLCLIQIASARESYLIDAIPLAVFEPTPAAALTA